MGNYYYKRDADGNITDKKKYRTPQSNPSGVGKAVGNMGKKYGY